MRKSEERSAFWRRVYFDEVHVIHSSTWISSPAAPSCGKDSSFPWVAPKPVGGDPWHPPRGSLCRAFRPSCSRSAPSGPPESPASLQVQATSCSSLRTFPSTDSASPLCCSASPMHSFHFRRFPVLESSFGLLFEWFPFFCPSLNVFFLSPAPLRDAAARSGGVAGAGVP